MNDMMESIEVLLEDIGNMKEVMKKAGLLLEKTA
jgi:hypothetical protein